MPCAAVSTFEGAGTTSLEEHGCLCREDFINALLSTSIRIIH